MILGLQSVYCYTSNVHEQVAVEEERGVGGKASAVNTSRPPGYLQGTFCPAQWVPHGVDALKFTGPPKSSTDDTTLGGGIVDLHFLSFLYFDVWLEHFIFYFNLFYSFYSILLHK